MGRVPNLIKGSINNNKKKRKPVSSGNAENFPNRTIGDSSIKKHRLPLLNRHFQAGLPQREEQGSVGGVQLSDCQWRASKQLALLSPVCRTVGTAMAAAGLFISMSSRSRGNRPASFKWHQRADYQPDKEEHLLCQLWGAGSEGGYKWTLAAFHHSTLFSAAMAFDGTWKADRNENYDKFLEKLGERLVLFDSRHFWAEIDGCLPSLGKASTSWSASWPSTTTWRSPSSRAVTSSTSRSPAPSAPRSSTSRSAWSSTTAWRTALKSPWVPSSHNPQTRVHLDVCGRSVVHGCVFHQGTWEMEGETMKGLFNRKDNNKLLTTTRSIVGGELVQVSAFLRAQD